MFKLDRKKSQMLIAGALSLTVILTGCSKKEESNTCTVTFRDGALTDSIVMNKGEYTSGVALHPKDGYTFLGWYYDNEEFDFSKPITEDITLEAKWTLSYDDKISKINEILEEKRQKGKNCNFKFNFGEEFNEYTLSFNNPEDFLEIEPLIREIAKSNDNVLITFDITNETNLDSFKDLPNDYAYSLIIRDDVTNLNFKEALNNKKINNITTLNNTKMREEDYEYFFTIPKLTLSVNTESECFSKLLAYGNTNIFSYLIIRNNINLSNQDITIPEGIVIFENKGKLTGSKINILGSYMTLSTNELDFLLSVPDNAYINIRTLDTENKNSLYSSAFIANILNAKNINLHYTDTKYNDTLEKTDTGILVTSNGEAIGYLTETGLEREEIVK